MDSKGSGLRAKKQNEIAEVVRRELAPALEAIHKNQTELQSGTRRLGHLLDVQQDPWRKAGAMLWGMVIGALLFAFLQPQIQHGNQACRVGDKIMDVWPSLSEVEQSLIERITSK